MDNKEKPQGPRVLGDDPFIDMDTLEWLGIESPPAPAGLAPQPVPAPEPEPETAPATSATDETAPEGSAGPSAAAHTIPDDAERALQEWLGEETPPVMSPTEATPAAETDPETQNELLSWLFSEQQLIRDDS